MKLKAYPIGYFHIDIAEEQTEEGKLYLFVAIDRTSKFAYAELHEEGNRWAATDFLKAPIKTVPYKIHVVLTDNGIQLTDLPKNRIGPTARWRALMFDMLCDANDTEHRPTKSNHSWTKGQVERMHRHAQRGHGEATAMERMPSSKELHAFMMAYKFVKQTRRSLTLASSSFAKFGRHSQIGSVKFASPHLGLNIEAAPQGCWISHKLLQMQAKLPIARKMWGRGQNPLVRGMGNTV